MVSLVCERDVFEILTEPPKKGTAGGAGTSSVEDGERKAKQPKPGHQIDTNRFRFAVAPAETVC
jgi:hypothetical protein